MIEVGKKQLLTVVKKVDFGVYLSDSLDKEAQDPADRVLLPIKQVPEGTEVADSLSVFIYRDSEDRLIATTREPMLQVGGLAVLTVKQVGRIGAFLDWGLEKDLFLPFKQQTAPVKPGEQCLVTLYVDKSHSRKRRYAEDRYGDLLADDLRRHRDRGRTRVLPRAGSGPDRRLPDRR